MFADLTAQIMREDAPDLSRYPSPWVVLYGDEEGAKAAKELGVPYSLYIPYAMVMTNIAIGYHHATKR